jgi:predicted transcriptional regulator
MFMKKFQKKCGFPPGMHTIATSLGDTKSNVQAIIGALLKKGLIIKRNTVQEGMYEVIHREGKK